MSNPFPGMNPYLEDPAFWGDFHHTFINYWRESIADELPEDYEARIGEHDYLVKESPQGRKLTGPDVAILKGKKRQRATGPAPTGTSTLVPVVSRVVLLEEQRQGYIEILHRPKRNVVAVLEMLSPANKEDPGRRAYLAKRNAVLHQEVHLVELDLLLHGRRLPLADPLPPGDYYYLVSDGTRRPECKVYGWGLREALPVVPVPLLPRDGAVLCDLGAVCTTAFARGRYDRVLQYRNNPRVQLPPQERQWARQQIRAGHKED